MSRKILTRIVPCTRNEFLKVQKQAQDAIHLASVHDPDLLKRIEILEKSLDRLINHINREIGVAQDIPLYKRI